MTGIAFSLALGVLLLGLMLYWWLHGEPSKAPDISTARDALGSLQNRFLPVGLAARIFDQKDLDYVRSLEEPYITGLLESERKSIALYWLRHTRRQVKTVMGFHVRSARHNSRLAISLEMKLALDYFAFLFVCDVLCGLIWIRGPFRARGIARGIRTIAARFCARSEGMLISAEVRRPALP